MKPAVVVKKWPWYLVPLAHLLLSFGFSWPLLANFSRAVPFGPPDNYQNIWNFWWVRTVLFERHLNPYQTDLLFYPYRAASNPLSLYLHPLQLPVSLPGGLLSALFGTSAGFNLIILIGYVATGWATYALARYFIGNELAAFLASVLYNFAPFHQHALGAGQTEVFWQHWIPLYILFLHQSLNEGRMQLAPTNNNNPVKFFLINSKFKIQNSKFKILAVLCLWLALLSNLYYFVYLVLYSAGLYLVLAIIILRRRSAGEREERLRNLWQLTRHMALIGLLALLLASPVIWGMLRSIQDADVQYVDTLEETVINSATPGGWFTPLRTFWGSWRAFYLGYGLVIPALLGLCVSFGLTSKNLKAESAEQTETLNSAPSALTSVSSAFKIPKALNLGRRWVWWWAAVALAGLLLSLGPYLRWSQSDSPVQAMQDGLPLPYLLLYQIPFINISRSPMRFAVMTTLALSLLAGWGFAWLQPRLVGLLAGKSFSRWRIRMAQMVLPVLLLVSFSLEVNSVPLTLDELYYPKFLDEIARDPNKTYGLLELPISDFFSRDGRRMFFQTIHHHPISGGYIARSVRQYYYGSEPIGYFFGPGASPSPPEAIFRDTPPQIQLKVLQIYNKLYQMPYLLHYRDDYIKNPQDQFPKMENYLQSVMGTSARIFEDGRTSVYRVPDAPATLDAALLVNSAGGYPVEKLPDGKAYRWVERQLDIELLASRETEVQLDFTAWSLLPDNALAIRLEGNQITNLKLAPGPETQSLKIKLQPGPNTLSFTSLKAAAFPQDLGLPYTDPRKLAFALGDVKLS